MAEKPTGGKAFDALAKLLVQVPKKEILRERKKAKAKRKKK